MDPLSRDHSTRAGVATTWNAFFVPWAASLLETLPLPPRRLLDLAAGAGTVTGAARERWPGCFVISADLAYPLRPMPPGPAVGCNAQALPLAGQSVDAVVSLQGLQFFRDRLKAIREILRVLRVGGFFASAVWAPLSHNPIAAGLARALGAVMGPEAQARFLVPFMRGDGLAEQVSGCGEFECLITERRSQPIELTIEDIVAGVMPDAVRRTLSARISEELDTPDASERVRGSTFCDFVVARRMR